MTHIESCGKQKKGLKKLNMLNRFFKIATVYLDSTAHYRHYSKPAFRRCLVKF